MNGHRVVAQQRKAARLEAVGRIEDADRVRRAVSAQELRLKKLDGQLPSYRRQRCTSRGERDERLRTRWRATRQGRLYSQGDTGKGDNPNSRVGYGSGVETAREILSERPFTRWVVISHLSEIALLAGQQKIRGRT